MSYIATLDSGRGASRPVNFFGRRKGLAESRAKKEPAVGEKKEGGVLAVCSRDTEGRARRLTFLTAA
jgi:hypothetical protein